MSFCVLGKLLKSECKLLFLLLLAVLLRVGIKLLRLKEWLGIYSPELFYPTFSIDVDWVGLGLWMGLMVDCIRDCNLFGDDRFPTPWWNSLLLKESSSTSTPNSPNKNTNTEKSSKLRYQLPIHQHKGVEPRLHLFVRLTILGLLRRRLYRWCPLRSRLPSRRRHGLQTQLGTKSRWIRRWRHVSNLQPYRICWSLEWIACSYCHGWNSHWIAMVSSLICLGLMVRLIYDSFKLYCGLPTTGGAKK